MKRVSLLSLTALIWLLGMNAWALEQKDGVYQIGSAEDLASFAQAVSAGETGLNAVLTADIDNYTGPMIGTSTVQYTGIFDGQYHKITLQSEATEDVWALFRTLRGTVKNLHVAGTITTSFKQVGGVAGFIYNAIIENCVSSVDIISSFSGDSGMGGIAASSLEAGNYLTNCIFAGTIQGSAANSCGGIIGWTSKAATLVNCLVVGEITANSKNGDVIARNAKNATRVNCYYVNAYGSIPSDVKQLTAEQLKSGEVAYMLNGNQQNIIWTQTLDKDAYPVPLKNGAQVYAVASGYQCDGTPQGEATYSNTAPGTAFTAHSFTDGVCSVCGSPDPAYMQPNAQGAYEISTAAQLNWFATKVNLGETNLDAVIMQDIVYTGAMIGSPTWRYSGTFDGQFHKISYTTEAAAPIWGLFRVVSGTVKNLFVDGTITTAVNECGGLAGDLYGAAIENVVSTVKIISSFSGDSAHGGLVSRNMKTGSTITNCMFAGSIEGEATNNCAAFIGWTPFVATLTNCLTIGEIKTAVNDGNMIARNPANAKRINCYYMNPYGAIPDDITLITPEQLASGEVCWLLNGDQKTIGWTQTLKEQVAPTPNPSGKQVFASPSEGFRCDGTALGETVYSNTDPNMSIPDHQFSDGFCTVCGGVDVAYGTLTEDGFYELSTEKQLSWFATRVNNGETELNARLTADIDNYTGPMIGNTEIIYAGTFDGNGHKITFITEPTEPVWSLFRKLSGTVKNLYVAGTITTSQKQCAGIAGFIYGATIENCVCTVDIISSFSGDSGMGGLVATNSAAGSVIKNCVFAGTIQGAKATSCGGIIGWTPQTATLINCLVIGDISTSTSGGNTFARNPSKVTRTNCYYLKPYATVPNDVTQVTEEQLKSGEVCYLLNSGAEGMAFYQNLTTDAYPVFDKTRGIVYKVGTMKCDGEADAISYSNTNTGASYGDHTFGEDGVCSVCGMGLVDGIYQISKAVHMQWFSDFVNKGNYKIDAVLTADIDMTPVKNFIPIAVTNENATAYQGTFDGQGHTISNLTIHRDASNTGYVGLFSHVYYGVVKNLIVKTVTITTDSETPIATGAVMGRNGASKMINVAAIDVTFNLAAEGTDSKTSHGGLSGAAANSANTLVENCYTDYPLMGYVGAKAVCKNYYVGDEVTAMAPTGELCYKMNQGDIQNPTWRQSVGYDAYPVMDAAHGIVNKIGATGYATQFIAESNVLIPDGVTANVGVINTPWITLTPLTNIIPAGTAVVLEGAEGYYSFIPVTVEGATVNNDLKGTAAPLAADGKQYVLAEKDGVVGFYKADGTIPAGKAYIEYAGAAGVKGFFFGDADGIENLQMVNGELPNGKWYDLSGRRVEKPTKGIYIINGKKVLR